MLVFIVCIGITSVINARSLKNIQEDEFLTFKNSEDVKVGQIWADQETLTMYGYNGKDVEIGAGGGVIINAEGGSVSIRQGNDTKIRITEDSIDFNTKNLFINGIRIDISELMTYQLEEMSKDLKKIRDKIDEQE